jgi:hypothetical protein
VGRGHIPWERVHGRRIPDSARSSFRLQLSRQPSAIVVGGIDPDLWIGSDQRMDWVVTIAGHYWRRDALPPRRRPIDNPANDNAGISPRARKRAMDQAAEHMAGLLRGDDRLADAPLWGLAEIVTRGGGVVAWRRPTYPSGDGRLVGFG